MIHLQNLGQKVDGLVVVELVELMLLLLVILKTLVVGHLVDWVVVD